MAVSQILLDDAEPRDVWMSSDFFQIAAPPKIFVRFSRNCAHMVCVPIHQNCVTDFRNLDLKFLATF